MMTSTIERVRALVAEGRMSRAGLARAAGLHANTLRDCTEEGWNPTTETTLGQTVTPTQHNQQSTGVNSAGTMINNRRAQDPG